MSEFNIEYRELLSLIDQVRELESRFAALKSNLTDVVYVEPAKPREGMFALADGAMWNPGFGKGLYQYLDGMWVPVGGLDGWTAPTLQNGWVNFGAGYAAAGYTKDNTGFVHLKGAIKDGTFTDATVLFALPAGYQAMDAQLFMATNTLGGDCKILVGADVSIYSAASNAQVTLDGISFTVL